MSNLENKDNATLSESPVTEAVVEAPVILSEEPAASAESSKENDEIITNERTVDPTQEPSPVQVLGNVNGAIGATTTVPKPKQPIIKNEKKAAKETVAIHSTKNVTWPGVGKVYVGYNIVGKDESEKWLTRSHVRLATPQEVAKEFGK